MALFSETVDAKLSGRAIGASLLVDMDIADARKRWWMGFGDLEAGSQTWQGTGEWITVSGLDQAIGTTASKATFSISAALPGWATLVSQAGERVKGRDATIYIQFFDVTPAGGSQMWAKLDSPYAVWAGIMDQLSYTAAGATERTIALTAESLWTGRRKPPFGSLSDLDQKARHPGDRGMEQVAALVFKSIRWPVF